MLTPAPEIKLRLTVHEDAVATAPSPEALKAQLVAELGVEPALFIVERIVRRRERTRLPALRTALRLEDQIGLWLSQAGASAEPVDDARRARLEAKVAEVVGA